MRSLKKKKFTLTSCSYHATAALGEAQKLFLTHFLTYLRKIQIRNPKATHISA